ncbi:MAG: YihY/virulence factor BrkB family protein [Oscillospiraceae bacterium]|jgi:membrane protein|nr:YihY/virulence factor BrkB family protein [Oscillospiraceae bacterium]
MARAFVRYRVTRSAAALSYYLFLSAFPLLICCSAIIGSLNITQESLISGLGDVVPDGAIAVIGDFLRYVGGDRSAPTFAVGIVVMITTSAAAFSTIMGIMGDIQGGGRFGGAAARLLSFALSVGFLAVIYVSGLIVVTGEWFMRIIRRSFNLDETLALWNPVRFVILFLLMLAVIYAIYIISAPKETKGIRRLPGAAAAAVALVGVSLAFSRLISESAKYAIVYGYLASFIVMLVWLYTCGIILIMGNVFNIVFRGVFNDKNSGEQLHQSGERKRLFGGGGRDDQKDERE